MMKRETFAIADIYVPIKRRTTLEQKRVDEIPPACSTTASGRRSWCERTASALYWLRVCIDWRPPRRSAKKPSSAFLSPRGNTKSPAPSIALVLAVRALMTVPNPGWRCPAISAVDFLSGALSSYRRSASSPSTTNYFLTPPCALISVPIRRLVVQAAACLTAVHKAATCRIFRSTTGSAGVIGRHNSDKNVEARIAVAYGTRSSMMRASGVGR